MEIRRELRRVNERRLRKISRRRRRSLIKKTRSFLAGWDVPARKMAVADSANDPLFRYLGTKSADRLEKCKVYHERTNDPEESVESTSGWFSSSAIFIRIGLNRDWSKFSVGVPTIFGYNRGQL